jgi:hypothetical protein
VRHLSRSIILFALVSSLGAYSQLAVAQQKTIKDPAEYNAYIAALNINDPKQKAAAMEAFVSQYPNSVVKIDAMEQAMAAYQRNLVRILTLFRNPGITLVDICY